MADGVIRGQRTADRRQRRCRGIAAPLINVPRSGTQITVLCLLSSVFCPLNAEELSDPTRPPAAFLAPSSAVAESAPASPGLQSIIISKTRRAAIIDGETVELGGKHGDAKLIEVNEGHVVLRGAEGRQVLTLFPDVKVTAVKVPAESEDQKVKTNPKPSKNAAHPENKKANRAASGEVK